MSPIPELPPKIEKSDIKVIVLSGAFLTLLGLILIAFGYYLLRNSQQDYHSLLSEGAHILVQQTGVTVYYGGFPLLIGMLLMGLYSLWLALRGERYPAAVNRKVMKLVTVLIIAGLIGMFVGRYIANTLWAETFENAGYARCSGSFSITKQWSTVVWVVDPYLCTDEKVRDLFRSFEHDLSDINAYLAANRSSGVYQ